MLCVPIKNMFCLFENGRKVDSHPSIHLDPSIDLYFVTACPVQGCESIPEATDARQATTQDGVKLIVMVLKSK